MESELFHTLCSKLNFSDVQLVKSMILAPVSYKVYSIPKKNGGLRTIAHPAKKLKEIQQELLALLEKDLKIHESAFAYIKGKSIIHNANVHKKNKFLLKLDFHDFFNSISNDIFIQYLEKIGVRLNKIDKLLISYIFFWNPNKKEKSHKKLILSVGSPSSPKISNAIMYYFDDEIKKYCHQRAMEYSRYADDISISGNEKDELKKVIPIIRKKLNEFFDGRIILNELKTVIVSPGYNKFITGITLTPQGNLSIGRKRKKYIFSLIYQYTKNELSEDLIAHLRGLLSFSHDVEPSFIKRLESKYGKEIIRSLVNEK